MKKSSVKKTHKRQFSKIWLACCIMLSAAVTAVSFLLSALGRDPVSGLAAAVIDALWGTSGVSFVGYAIQNSVRAYTASKFGLPGSEKKAPDSDI